jgi:hypothetical protein
LRAGKFSLQDWQRKAQDENIGSDGNRALQGTFKNQALLALREYCKIPGTTMPGSAMYGSHWNQ